MDYRIISLPSFTAVTSGPDPDMDFSPQGRLGKFNAYFSAITPSPRDAFMPRDFLFFNAGAGGLEWWWALEEGMPDGGFPKVFFEGGIYLTYTYRDHDQEENNRLYQEAVAFVNSSAVFQLDERPGHYSMGHIITPPRVIPAQGFALMECFVPIRLKQDCNL